MNLSYRNQKNAEATANLWGKSIDRADWFKIEAKSDDEAEITIYDVIGWPYVEASDFVRELSSVKAKSIKLRINSPGGDVFDGMAIFNALKDHPAHITTQVDGLAASMASVIAMAGDEVTMHKNSMLMIHNAWVVVAGDRNALASITDVLAKIDGNILDIYYGKTGHGKRELKAMMDAETWLTAEDAKEFKLIDAVLDSETRAKAQFDLRLFAKTPDGLMVEAGGRDLTRKETERALRNAGASRDFARSIAAKGAVDGVDMDVIQEIMKLKLAINGGK